MEKPCFCHLHDFLVISARALRQALPHPLYCFGFKVSLYSRAASPLLGILYSTLSVSPLQGILCSTLSVLHKRYVFYKDLFLIYFLFLLTVPVKEQGFLKFYFNRTKFILPLPPPLCMCD